LTSATRSEKYDCARAARAESFAASRSAVLACQFASPASTVRRTLPHRSSSQLDAATLALKVFTAPVANEGALESDGDLLRTAEAFADTVGKYPARAWSAIDFACRSRASAARTFWLEMSRRASSRSSSASPNTDHHEPRGASSWGVALRQPSSSLNEEEATVSGR
jgi:hypothetical protein